MSIALNFLPGVFICYGAIMGIGLGVGYLTPVKNLMLWFADNKGLATGIAVAGFGLAKAIASPLMEYLIGTVGLVSMFFILAAVYAVMMFVASCSSSVRPLGVRSRDLTRQPQDNPQEARVLGHLDSLLYQHHLRPGPHQPREGHPARCAQGLPAVCQPEPRQVCRRHLRHHRTGARRGLRVQHGWPRGLLHTLRPPEAPRDRLSGIFIMSIAVCLLQIFTNSINNALLWAVLAMLFLINAGYGGGFSTLPVLLDQHFGTKTVSTTHGLALSAWAFAGLSGNQLASFVVTHTPDQPIATPR